MDQKPSVGRVVHYVSYGTPKGEYQSMCRAAIISAVSEDAEFDKKTLELAGGIYHYPVSLVVLNPEGLFFNKNVEYDDTGKKGGTWHWPERV